MVSPITLEMELQKHPEIKPRDIQSLRDWLRTQPHLPEPKISDLELLLAFHACDFSMEVSKQVLDLHYTLRTQLPFLRDLIVHDQKDYTLGVLALLPTAPDGYKTIYSRIYDTDPKNFTMARIARMFVMMTDFWLHEKGTWPGFIFIIDMGGIAMGHLTKLDVTVVQHFLYFLQEAIFVKVKSVHFINAPGFMESLLRLLRPFLNASILDLIHVHQGCQLPGVGLDALPKDAGGTWKDCKTLIEEQSKLLTDNAEFFLENSKKVVDEGKRPGKQKTISDFFGTQGSFKKLDID